MSRYRAKSATIQEHNKISKIKVSEAGMVNIQASRQHEYPSQHKYSVSAAHQYRARQPPHERLNEAFGEELHRTGTIAKQTPDIKTASTTTNSKPASHQVSCISVRQQDSNNTPRRPCKELPPYTSLRLLLTNASRANSPNLPYVRSSTNALLKSQPTPV